MLKNFFFFLLLTFTYSSSLLAREQINNFDAQFYISKDGTVRVEENIEYQFIDVYRHGIIRQIPYEYKKGKHNYNIRINVAKVTDFSGNEYEYEVSKRNGYLVIKIGDPDTTVTGTHGYRIEYFVKRAVLDLEDHDELYWNVTGTEWNVPIQNSTARVYFEGELPGEEDLEAKCFTGKFGSSEQNCSYDLSNEGVLFQSNDSLWGREGLTIVLGFPTDLVEGPSKLAKFLWFFRDNIVYGVPFFTLALLGFVWRKYGRDPDKGKPIAVRYEPPDNLTPAEAGALYDERADMIDLTSTVIDLAVRGYLKIEEIESTKFLFLSDRDYKLLKLKDGTSNELKQHEISILSGLFEHGTSEVQISSLKNKFYLNLKDIKDSVYSELVRSRYFLTNPERIRKIYKSIGFGVIFVSLFFFSGVITKLMFALSGLLIVIFARYMPRKTRKGTSVNHHILGFREFIDRAEKDRIEKLASEDPTVFDRILPFALVFGLEEKWAEAFSNVFTNPPDWYTSSRYGSGFYPRIFVNDLGRSVGIMNKSFLSSPRNSSGARSIGMGGGLGGGGFSGGGFGGGGGGSW